MTVRDEPALRRGLLAVAVLHDLDITPTADGIRLGHCDRLLLPWAELAAALDGAHPESVQGNERLAGHARARLLLAAAAPLEPRPLGIPVGHPLHPGRAWVQDTIAGGVLDVGLGVAGLRPASPARILPLPPVAGWAAELETEAWQKQASSYLEEMAGLAMARFARRPNDPLRPMGDCDVVTLLASRTFRAGLVAGDAGTPRGLRTAAVPRRDRGWLDLRRIDPEFVACAAAATDPGLRGFAHPLLVTADEVALAGSKDEYFHRSSRHHPIQTRSIQPRPIRARPDPHPGRRS